MYKILLVFAFHLYCLFAYAQGISSSFIKEVDSLFSEFNRNTPGCAMAIVKDDSVIFSKNYGMANLEKQLPITSETLFNLASLSKQFTGMGVALLAREGKINLDDEITKYLQWVPDFKQKITIRHLLHHTSGIRDHLVMSLLGGLPGNGLLTQDVAMRYIKNYEGLNFFPGENHSYSNSNYVLLAEIIKKVSGKPFNQFMDSAIFKPLGMIKSFFAESNALSLGDASSYNKTGSVYNPIFLNVYTNGDGGLYSTLNDMLRWISNFFIPKVGDVNIIKQLTEPIYLNNGKKIIYGMGIGAVYDKGYKQYTHSGGIAGFRSSISIFPELNFSILLLSNHAAGRIGIKTNQVIDLYLREIKKSKETVSPAKNPFPAFMDTILANTISGSYLAENGAKFSFNFKEGKLFFQKNQVLTDRAHNGITLVSDTAVTFSVKIDGKDTTIHYYAYGYNHLLRKYQIDSVLTTESMKSYIGVYYCKELDKAFTITMNNDNLVFSNFLHGEVKLQALTKDNLFFQNGVTHLKMMRDPKQKIYGFEYSNSSVTKLKFIKFSNN